MRDVRVVRADEAKLCEGVRETIFLSLGLGTASSLPVARPFWTNFCRQACFFKHFLMFFEGSRSVFADRHGCFKVSCRESAGIHVGFKHF